MSTIDAAAQAAIARCAALAPQSASPRTIDDPGLSLQDDLRGGQHARDTCAGSSPEARSAISRSRSCVRAGVTVFSNAPLSADVRLQDAAKSVGHTLIDMGDDEHTRGRLHPMIDGTLRAQRIIDESLDPEVAILLLDFILGTNAAQDPVGDIVGAIVEGRQRRPKEAGGLLVVASICGTEEDPQDLSLQSEALIDAGVHVFWGNARATEYCLEQLGRE